MKKTVVKLSAWLVLLVLLASCDITKRSTAVSRPNQPPKSTAHKPTPMDTVRWSNPNTGRPPIGPPTTPTHPTTGQTYHIAYLLPFLSNQMSGTAVPEKSQLAMQFYAGAKIALEQLSTETKINLVVDVWDTQSSDADFQKLMTNARLEKASVFIGPIRSSHVELFAPWAKSRRKILVSPESPSSGLTSQNPDFIQMNPSLRAHCEAITRHIRRIHRPDAVTLVCKEKEADRLPYFQNANQSVGGSGRFSELILPDAVANFDKIDLRKYLREGRTSVFVLPVWGSQDFVMSFLRKLKDTKGNQRVEVYGMPQWRNFEAIEREYLSNLNVHISAATWPDYSKQELIDFQEKFYNTTGTIPDDDALNGYDVTLFVGRMLAKYGLSFPERLNKEQTPTLRSRYAFSKISGDTTTDAAPNKHDYWENTFVYIMKFDKNGFVPVY